MGYLTPNAAPDSVTCRALFVPDNEDCLAIVRGAIQELTFSYNWTKYGTLSPDESAALFVDMFDAFCFGKGPCRVIGEIVTYAGASSPNPNWLVCDGSEQLIADYPDLYAVISDIYGTAAEDYFKLPDLRGRSPSGTGTGEGLSTVTLGDSYGEQSHVLTVTEIPAHSHVDSGHQHSIPTTVTFLALTGEEPVNIPVPLVPSFTGIASANIGNTGGGGAHNTVGPRLGLLHLIVAKDG